MASQPAKQDVNKVPTLIAITGTIGDTYGTAQIVPLTATPDGFLNVNATVSAGDTPGGTLDLVSSIGALPDLPGGTIDSITTLPDIPGGTIDSVGGTVNINIAADGVGIGGGVQYNSGTATPGTVTGNALMFDNNGTINTVADDNGLPVTLATQLDATNDSVSIGGGTLDSLTALPDIPGGTIDSITAIAALPDLPGGTIDSITTLPDLPGGTVDEVSSVANVAGGTVQINPLPSRSIQTFGTVISGTAETEIVAAPGSGTATWITYFSIKNKGTADADCYLGFGTATANGASLIDTGVYAASSGVVSPLSTPLDGNVTNHALQFQNLTGGTIAVNVQYWTE